MKQKRLAIQQLTISYIDANEDSDKIIFFIHGNSSSSKTWFRQMTYKSFSNFRLIAFDLPGHGESSHSKNPADEYSAIATGKVMAEAVNILSGKNRFILAGFSYGTNVVAEMLLNGVHPAGIVLIG